MPRARSWTDEGFIEAVRSSVTIREVSTKLGLRGKGRFPARQVSFSGEELRDPTLPAHGLVERRSLEALLLQHELHDRLRRYFFGRHRVVLRLVRLDEYGQKLESVVGFASLHTVGVQQRVDFRDG
jgi:hypothetical protein